MQNYQKSKDLKFYELMEDPNIQLLSEKFSEIHLKSFSQESLRFSSMFIYSLLKKPNIYYIYRENVGFCIYSFYKEEAEIITMAILPKYQNQGIGFLIMKELEEILLYFNCNKIFLEVASNNLIAIKLYINSGFKKIGIRKSYYKISKYKKVDAFLMKKLVKLKS